jgi:hypothetical protein
MHRADSFLIEAIDLCDPRMQEPLARLIPAVSTQVGTFIPDASAQIRSVHEAPPSSETLDWNAFEQDGTGQHVYLYRGLHASQGSDSHHLSVAAQGGTVTLADLAGIFGTNNLLDIVAFATGATGSYSPLLHTSRSREIALGFVARYGELVRYKIPKTYIIEQSGRFFRTHVGEDEISILFGLPPEFIDRIEAFDEGRLPDIEGVSPIPAEIRLEF